MNYQPFITSVLQEASLIALEKFGKVTATVKEGNSNSIVTEADLAVGKYIIQRLKKDFPDYNIIDEETGAIDNSSEFTWIIDPIDGTSNFAQGIPTYGVMLGLLKNTTPYAGGISLPSFSQIITAQKDKGAFLADKKLSVSNEKKLLHVLVTYHIDGHQEEPELTRSEVKILGEIILSVRNIRIFETCFDSILVAKGNVGGYLNRTSKIWDNVAPQIIIEEAGGLYTDFFGKPIDYTKPLEKIQQNFTVCAAPPELYEQLQAIIHKKSL